MSSWIRRNGLRVVFTATLAWAALGLFMEPVFAWVPDARRGLIESALIMAIILACGLAVWAISRHRPTFMRTPTSVPLASWGRRALAVVPLVYVLLVVSCGLLAFAELRLAARPSDPQYGVSVAWAVVWYPVILTPVVSIVVLTRSLARQAR